MYNYVLICLKILYEYTNKILFKLKVKQNDNLHPVQDSGSLAVFKVTARDQGHFKGPSGAFETYCNISCSFYLSKKISLDVSCESSA